MYKTAWIYFVLLLVIFVGCKSDKVKTTGSNQELQVEPRAEDIFPHLKNITGRTYFDYDELDYYYTDDTIESKLYDERLKSINKLTRYNVIMNNVPRSIEDTSFISKLEKIGFKRIIIGRDRFQIINEYFKEKKVDELYGRACISIYRDILIFKRNGRVIGVAKICFGCGDNQIVGTDAITDTFGMNGDYEKLQTVLYKERKHFKK